MHAIHRASHLALLIVLIVLTGVAAGDDPDPRETALARIRGEIARLEERLGEMKSRETGLEAEVARIRLELELQEQQLAEATAAFELAGARAGAAQAKVEELAAALAGVREDLRRRLGGLYLLGRQGYLRLFLALRPDRDLLPAIRQLRYLVRRDQMALDRYRSTRDELDRERRRLEAQHQEMEAWRRREVERRDALVRLRRRHERLLEEVSRQRRELAQRAGELEDKERKLSRLIASLVGAGATPLAGTPIQEFRGVLDWPLAGQVVGGFGPRRDLRYKTEVPHNGIDVAVDASAAGARVAEVRAVFPGEVLFASQFEGYGQMVVLHHPGRVFTLYSRLTELRVAKGDVVSLGAVVGVAADLLYFEIRRENQAEDPLRWLR
ncbi:MAG TPA: peptidoglycan DD-metalloendopeptidase family protein [Thermoanaerobaculia bacterium]|jgi:septal ring factor EnvC (AmiA/AmiB activator)